MLHGVAVGMHEDIRDQELQHGQSQGLGAKQNKRATASAALQMPTMQNDHALDCIIRDVAARIIQAHWRTHKLRRGQGAAKLVEPRYTDYPAVDSFKPEVVQHGAASVGTCGPATQSIRHTRLAQSPVQDRSIKPAARQASGARSHQPDISRSLTGSRQLGTQATKGARTAHSQDALQLSGITQQAPRRGVHKVYTVCAQPSSSNRPSDGTPHKVVSCQQRGSRLQEMQPCEYTRQHGEPVATHELVPPGQQVAVAPVIGVSADGQHFEDWATSECGPAPSQGHTNSGRVQLQDTLQQSEPSWGDSEHDLEGPDVLDPALVRRLAAGEVQPDDVPPEQLQLLVQAVQALQTSSPPLHPEGSRAGTMAGGPQPTTAKALHASSCDRVHGRHEPKPAQVSSGRTYRAAQVLPAARARRVSGDSSACSEASTSQRGPVAVAAHLPHHRSGITADCKATTDRHTEVSSAAMDAACVQGAQSRVRSASLERLRMRRHSSRALHASCTSRLPGASHGSEGSRSDAASTASSPGGEYSQCSLDVARPGPVVDTLPRAWAVSEPQTRAGPLHSSQQCSLYTRQLQGASQECYLGQEGLSEETSGLMGPPEQQQQHCHANDTGTHAATQATSCSVHTPSTGQHTAAGPAASGSSAETPGHPQGTSTTPQEAGLAGPEQGHAGLLLAAVSRPPTAPAPPSPVSVAGYSASARSAANATEDDDLSAIDELRASQMLQLPHGVVLVHRSPEDSPGLHASGGNTGGHGNRYKDEGGDGGLGSPQSSATPRQAPAANRTPRSQPLVPHPVLNQPQEVPSAEEGHTQATPAQSRHHTHGALHAQCSGPTTAKLHSHTMRTPARPGSSRWHEDGMQDTCDGARDHATTASAEAPHYIWRSPLASEPDIRHTVPVSDVQHPPLPPAQPEPDAHAPVHSQEGTFTQPAVAAAQTVSAGAERRTPRVMNGSRHPAAPAVSPHSSLTADKVTSILSFLDQVEQRSREEEQLLGATRSTMRRGSTHSRRSTGAGSMGAGSRAGGDTPAAHPAQPPAEQHSAATLAHYRHQAGGGPETHHSAAEHCQQNPHAASGSMQGTGVQSAADALLQRIGLLAAASQPQALAGPTGSIEVQKQSTGPTDPAPRRSTMGSLEGGASAVSVASCAPSAAQGSHAQGLESESSWGKTPASLAGSLYEGVKAKMKRLQGDLRERDAAIHLLRQELEQVQLRAAAMVVDVETRTSETVASLKSEHEAALARHLSFMDRLLADKDELNRKVLAATEALQASEQRQERAISKLKEGWAVELRRQKEAWAAAERARREQWMENKTSEVKELTVKGLEVEVQKLLAKHKAELSAVQSAAAEDTRRALDVAAAQHELVLRQLREKLNKDQEEALEKERAGFQQRLREASERYEQQLSMQRLRLVADGDLRLEQLEAARREERKRHEEALSKVMSECEDRVRSVEEEGRREREAMRKAHDKQLNQLREDQSAEQEGWRAAVAERARREVADREVQITERLTKERDQQMQMVVQRLEVESTTAREALRADFARREQTMLSRHAAAMKDAQRGEARLQEQLRMTSEALQTTESRLASTEAALEVMRREADARASTIRWLESQVTAAQEQARSAEVGRLAAGNQAVQAVLAEKELVERRLVAAQRELENVRLQHSQELEKVEARVREALGRKDESLASAQQQIMTLAAQLRHTEHVLATQQADLGEM